MKLLFFSSGKSFNLFFTLNKLLNTLYSIGSFKMEIVGKVFDQDEKINALPSALIDQTL